MVSEKNRDDLSPKNQRSFIIHCRQAKKDGYGSVGKEAGSCRGQGIH